MSNEIGAIEKAVIWPQYVRDRTCSTYMYFTAVLVSQRSSFLAVRRTALMNLMMRGSGNSWCTFQLHPLSYSDDWSWSVGTVDNICLEPRPKASCLVTISWCDVCSGGFDDDVKGASSQSWVVDSWHCGRPLPCDHRCVCPVRSFWTWEHVRVGVGLVCVLTGIYVFWPTMAAAATLYSAAVYGGLVLCSMFLLYDKQKLTSMQKSYRCMEF